MHQIYEYFICNIKQKKNIKEYKIKRRWNILYKMTEKIVLSKNMLKLQIMFISLLSLC